MQIVQRGNSIITKFKEDFLLAFRSIKSNILRSLLTLLIIAFGIACLVGMLTAIDGFLYSLSDNFNKIGANSFSIRPAYETIKSSRRGRRKRIGEVIDYNQAMEFKERFTSSSAIVSISTWGTDNATLKYKSEKSSPTIPVVGIDENYLRVSAFELSEGRNFSYTEVNSGAARAIIGKQIVDILFDGKSEKAINQTISISNNKYKIIGILAEKGSSMGSSDDKKVFIPLLNAKQHYGYAKKRYNISATVNDPTAINDIINDAIGVMRNIRKLKASQENDFNIRKSDSILQNLKDATVQIRGGTIAIALMTLLGASIGLMNIMLVSVTERTKEIGVRKAIGANRTNILVQFLTEAVVITILGGLVGIFFGVGIGLGVAKLVGGSFVFPTNWIILALVVCIFVGVLSGLYPAVKASRLDPIESLRYE